MKKIKKIGSGQYVYWINVEFGSTGTVKETIPYRMPEKDLVFIWMSTLSRPIKTKTLNYILIRSMKNNSQYKLECLKRFIPKHPHELGLWMIGFLINEL